MMINASSVPIEPNDLKESFDPKDEFSDLLMLFISAAETVLGFKSWLSMVEVKIGTMFWTTLLRFMSSPYGLFAFAAKPPRPI